ncbi:MAG: shikimate dehydrogenase [Chloroflexia bacterium]
MGDSVSAPSLRVGLVGHPLGHSVSPDMLDAAFEEAGLPYRYELLDRAAEDLPLLLAEMRAGGWLGCNVTVPHKTRIVPLLDELRGEAEMLGAVNTVQVEGERLIGYNTDVYGFAHEMAAHNELHTPGPAVVLGAGGAARAVIWTLAQHGWKVDLLARRSEQAAFLVTGLPAHLDIRPGSLDAHTATERLKGARLLVNCTPAGMWPHEGEDPLPPGVPLPPDLFVYDLIYRPSETRLLARAAAAGCRTRSGLPMLVAQGAAAFTIWTGRDAPRHIMREAAERAVLSWEGEA